MQTGKIERFPIVAMGSDFWGTVQSLRDAAISEGTIDEGDRDLFDTTDNVEEAVRLLAQSAK